MTLDFTDKISKLGFQRVARLIAAEPAAIIEAFGPALASRRDCVDFFKKNKFLSWNFQNAPARYPAFPYSRTTAGQIVGPIFESLGVDTSDWSMDFLTRGRFAFCDRFCAPQYPDSDFVEALNKSFPGIDRYYNRDSCDSTLRELDEKLAPFFAAGTHLELAKRWQPAPADAVGTLRRCANCHTTDVRPGTPVIEFLNQDLLKRALAQAGHAHGTLLDEILYRTGSTASQRLQMPPSHPLAPDEQAALAQYLKTLAL